MQGRQGHILPSASRWAMTMKTTCLSIPREIQAAMNPEAVSNLQGRVHFSDF